MKNDEKNKSKKDKDIVTIKAANHPEPTGYSAIRRMLNSLDRFLTRRFMFILAFCTAAISMCVIGLSFTNTVGSSAASGGNSGEFTGNNLTLSIWLWSIIVVCLFIIVVTSVYVWGRRKNVKH